LLKQEYTAPVMATNISPKKSIIEEDDPFDALAVMIHEHTRRLGSEKHHVNLEDESDDNSDSVTTPTPKKARVTKVEHPISFRPVPLRRR
jgi:hypothetical protein